MEASPLRPAIRPTLPRSRALLATFSDDRLVETLRRGNEAAFEVIYDRHHRGALSFCRQMLGSREEAEDAVQQTFFSAYSDLLARDRPIRLKPWLYTIARNRCLSVLRARREFASELVERPTAGLADEVEQRADLRELLDDLAELPAQQRAALVLTEIEDISHIDIASILGCEATKVKSLVFQGRSALIDGRRARETTCERIREQVATLSGGALRRGAIRRHLKECPSCAAFRDDVRRQRQMLAIVLPVVPTLGLREGALAVAGLGAGAGASAGTGLGAGGLAASLATKAGVAKVAATAIAAGALGGGVAVTTEGDRAARSANAPPLGAQMAKGPGASAVGVDDALTTGLPRVRSRLPNAGTLAGDRLRARERAGRAREARQQAGASERARRAATKVSLRPAGPPGRAPASKIAGDADADSVAAKERRRSKEMPYPARLQRELKDAVSR